MGSPVPRDAQHRVKDGGEGRTGFGGSSSKRING